MDEDRTARRSSVVGDVRRRQIVAAAIEVIATDGLPRASLTRIADRAGLSSAGLITYHFRDRQQVLSGLVEDVLTRHDAHVDAALSAAGTAADELGAYIDAVVGFQDEHRADMSAVWQVIWSRMGAQTGDTGVGRPVLDKDPRLARVRAILDRGQADGSFRRDFDPGWMARTINAAALGFLDVTAAEPDVDAGSYSGQLQRTFLLAVRADRSPIDAG